MGNNIGRTGPVSAQFIADHIDPRAGALALVRVLAALGAQQEWDSETVEWVAEAIQPVAKHLQTVGIPLPTDMDESACEFWQAVAES